MFHTANTDLNQYRSEKVSSPAQLQCVSLQIGAPVESLPAIPPIVPPGAPIFPIFSGVGPVGLGLDFPRLTVSGATDVGCPGTYRP